jgi:riboflavin biosynthesis pyrimidine reductase
LAISDWGPEFEAFCARKTADADAAAIAPLVTEREDFEPALVAIGNDWSRAMFDGDFYASPARDDRLPATSLVFVQSRDRNTVATDPSALGGGDADKHLIYEGLSRVAADAVLGGAHTIGRGGIVLSVWRRELVALRTSLGRPRHPAQVVATINGISLESGLLFNAPELRVFVLTVSSGFEAMRAGLTARPWITAIVMERSEDLRPAFAELRAAGIARLSCIGGRTLAEQVIDSNLVADVYLTTSARSGGEPHTPLYSKSLSAKEVLRKRGTGADAGVVFQHLVLPT